MKYEEFVKNIKIILNRKSKYLHINERGVNLKNKGLDEIGRIMMSYDKKFKFFIKSSLKGNELNVAEALVLLSLYERDGQTQESLLSSIYYDKSVMARTMKSLEIRKFICRNENPQDKRSYIFNLTEAGTSLEPEIIRVLRKWCDLAFDGLNGDEISILLGTMRKIQKNIEKE